MGSFLATIIGGLIMGLIIGPLARLIMPGKQDISLGWTILVGAAAAIVGGFIADVIGVGDTSGIDWIKLFIQLALAVAGIYWFLRLQENR
jgi:uncharacterized membrane protein YeaQ/YmgE (transglycosylase-associated protein family)